MDAELARSQGDVAIKALSWTYMLVVMNQLLMLHNEQHKHKQV
jgi:hypothetical protein